MITQRQGLPSFATIISVVSIVLYCAGFLRVELELKDQKKRINALEDVAEGEAKLPHDDSNRMKLIKDTPGIFFILVLQFSKMVISRTILGQIMAWYRK